jgi:hypothetical protein
MSHVGQQRRGETVHRVLVAGEQFDVDAHGCHLIPGLPVIQLRPRRTESAERPAYPTLGMSFTSSSVRAISANASKTSIPIAVDMMVIARGRRERIGYSPHDDSEPFAGRFDHETDVPFVGGDAPKGVVA